MGGKSQAKPDRKPKKAATEVRLTNRPKRKGINTNRTRKRELLCFRAVTFLMGYRPHPPRGSRAYKRPKE